MTILPACLMRAGTSWAMAGVAAARASAAARTLVLSIRGFPLVDRWSTSRQHRRDEILRTLVLRLAEDVLRRSGLDDAAATHEDHAGGDLAGEAELGGDGEHRP